MVNQRPSFTTDLECAVDYFRPILQRLRIRQGATGCPVFLSAFPQLWNIENNGKWVITVLKANLVDTKARFLSQYHKHSKIMECFIIMDETCFVNAKVPNEIRKAVVVHEFCHFIALIYACNSTSEEVLAERLKERLSKTIDELNNKQVLKLYQFLNKMRSLDDFAAIEQTKDEHFRLNCEDLDLSYSDLFKNFLLSHQMFNEFFKKEDRERFRNLILSEKMEEAYNFYVDIAKHIAQEKWLTENFAVNQAIDILMKFYLHELE
jgi:hypothetical protein